MKKAWRYQRHGKRKSREYMIWIGMRSRCNNPKRPEWRNYGAKGITVSDEWSFFSNFINDMGPAPSPKHSLDRIDYLKGYSKENCRWASSSAQSRNTSRNKWYTIDGETLCLTDWCKRFGLCRETAYYRLKRGWSVAEAITLPSGAKR
jgi:hypothetical protein